jgi:hypothetical protein
VFEVYERTNSKRYATDNQMRISVTAEQRRLKEHQGYSGSLLASRLPAKRLYQALSLASLRINGRP